jgi:hypothetical protein
LVRQIDVSGPATLLSPPGHQDLIPGRPRYKKQRLGRKDPFSTGDWTIARPTAEFLSRMRPFESFRDCPRERGNERGMREGAATYPAQ